MQRAFLGLLMLWMSCPVWMVYGQAQAFNQLQLLTEHYPPENYLQEGNLRGRLSSCYWRPQNKPD